MDYQNSKIYQVTDLTYTKCYIGSTTQPLEKRFHHHKINYAGWKRGNQGKVLVYDLFDEFGLENCIIDLVDHHPCQSKEELNFIEGQYIRNVECINKRIEGTGKITQCPCGGSYAANHRATHFKTNKHQKFIQISPFLF